MELDPYYVERFEAVRGVTWDDVFGGDADAIARAIKFGRRACDYVPPATLAISDREVPGEHGVVPVRVYRRRDVGTGAAALVWMHGGAFRWGDLDMLEAHAVSAEIASRTGVVVVSVGYRLLPEFHYPAPLDDCFAVVTCIHDNAFLPEIDPGRLAVGGASAGANLAAGTALRARDESGPSLRAILLAYPGLHLRIPKASPEVAAKVALLPPLARFDDPRSRDDAYREYLGERYDAPPAYGVPGIADLSGLPPCAIANAEYDDLRPSGEAFGDALCRAGVVLDEWTEPGTAHGYLNAVGAVAGATATLDRFSDFLQLYVTR